MQQLGVGVEKNKTKKRKIPESEVTIKAMKEMNIDEILETIVVYESALNDKLCVENVQTLMNLYQKVDTHV